MRSAPQRKFTGKPRILILSICLLVCITLGQFSLFCFAENQAPEGSSGGAASSTPSHEAQDQYEISSTSNVAAQWQGLPVSHISFEGVAADRLIRVRDRLAQAVGAPLNPQSVAASMRQIYATGLLDSLEVVAQREGNGVALLFRGTPRMFIGTVTVEGAKGATVNTQLQRVSRLEPGTRLTEPKLVRSRDLMRQTLADNGFYQPAIQEILHRHPESQLTDIAYHVTSGPQARVGIVQVTGESGLNESEFRRYAHLREGALVDHDTGNRALSSLLKYYRSQDRLEAEIKLESRIYSAGRIDYNFTANAGPQVKVVVEGTPLSKERIKHLIPVFEEGSVDDDLLNEGNRRVRNYFQSLGYFDVKVDHVTKIPRPSHVLIAYDVQLGSRRSLEQISIEGNHYFDASTLKQLLNVREASTIDRHGVYSQALVAADVSALQSVYQDNGFSNVKIRSETSDGTMPAGGTRTSGIRLTPLALTYHIDEGEQQRVASVRLEGNEHVETPKLLALLNTESGQLLSPHSLAGDRDTLTTEYLKRGFSQAHVEIEEKNAGGDPSKVDVVFHVAEGGQVFVRNVLLTGLHYTKPGAVARAITLHPGDPLDESALQQTQRNLYEFALFNEVNAAVQNPAGEETDKTILLQAVEARRWTLTYGAGFEVQTGTPVNGCQGYLNAHIGGISCTPNGRTGISPRGLLAITRNNLFGREQSASIQGNYGLLEQKVDLIYQNPHLAGSKTFGLTFTGGYANSLDVTTYVASRLEAGFRLTQNFNGLDASLSRANTFIYGFDFRRVKVAVNSLQVYPGEVSTLATAARIGGPGFTWIRDTRDSAVDAHRGTYTSFQEFLSAIPFGAEAQFNRIDVSNSSFYGFDKNRLVIARNTRYGQERAFGFGSSEMIPLPERLYAGGATSIRGFSINAAGPRDPDTGYPIGGAGTLINSTELRLPPPTLPYFGDTLSFVLFHDMGNVFTNAGDAWPSILRVRQPDRDNCKKLTPPTGPSDSQTEPAPAGPSTSTGIQGACSFNYFSHTPGLGLRYHTPVGPVRLDFSYSLNPPTFPINVNYSQQNPYDNQHVGEASHFNFFFSLGQTF